MRCNPTLCYYLTCVIAFIEHVNTAPVDQVIRLLSLSLAAFPQVPFTVKPGIPGTFRWVTTYIARFDPVIDWPTD